MLFGIIHLFFWRIYKKLIRWWTRKCEIQRICENTSFDVVQGCVALEASMCLSKSKEVRDLVTMSKYEELTVHNFIDVILRLKWVKDECTGFRERLKYWVYLIIHYNALISCVQESKKPYSSENSKHEDSLLELWRVLMPDEKLEDRKCKQWEKLGFQGKDPATDFRGMGYLALIQLSYFATVHTELARSVLLKSQSPHQGYPFALVGIHTTQFLSNLLSTRSLRFQLFTLADRNTDAFTLDRFNELFVFVFVEFDKFWRQEGARSVMEFNERWAVFHPDITRTLNTTVVSI